MLSLVGMLFLLTGCPQGKDLPKKLDDGFEVADGAELLGTVFADGDGWTAYSSVSGNPITVWNEYARRSRSFTFESIPDADSACRVERYRLVCHATSYPEGSTTEALAVTLTYGRWLPAGEVCDHSDCGGTAERSFIVRYLQGPAAQELPPVSHGTGSPLPDGFRPSTLIPKRDLTLGGVLELTEPAPITVRLPDGTVTLGRPFTTACIEDSGIGLVVSVNSAPKWMEEVLSMPTEPSMQRLGADRIFTGHSHAFDGWDARATGTRTEDGDFVMLSLCLRSATATY